MARPTKEDVEKTIGVLEWLNKNTTRGVFLDALHVISVLDPLLVPKVKEPEAKEPEVKEPEAEEIEPTTTVSDPQNSFVSEDVAGNVAERTVLPLSLDVDPVCLKMFRLYIKRKLSLTDKEVSRPEVKEPEMVSFEYGVGGWFPTRHEGGDPPLGILTPVDKEVKEPEVKGIPDGGLTLDEAVKLLSVLSNKVKSTEDLKKSVKIVIKRLLAKEPEAKEPESEEPEAKEPKKCKSFFSEVFESFEYCMETGSSVAVVRERVKTLENEGWSSIGDVCDIPHWFCSFHQNLRRPKTLSPVKPDVSWEIPCAGCGGLIKDRRGRPRVEIDYDDGWLHCRACGGKVGKASGPNLREHIGKILDRVKADKDSVREGMRRIIILFRQAGK